MFFSTDRIFTANVSLTVVKLSVLLASQYLEHNSAERVMVAPVRLLQPVQLTQCYKTVVLFFKIIANKRYFEV